LSSSAFSSAIQADAPGREAVDEAAAAAHTAGRRLLAAIVRALGGRSNIVDRRLHARLRVKLRTQAKSTPKLKRWAPLVS
jgi:hypothetical protein